MVAYVFWHTPRDDAQEYERALAAYHAALAAGHREIAALADTGAGGIYRLLRGEPRLEAAGVRWADKPRGLPYDDFHAQLGPDVWQRRLVLGPAPEYCLPDGDGVPRVRVA